MKKNVASQVIGAQMINSTTGAAFTGSVTVAVLGDGGTQATGSVGAGACAHEGNGFHTYAPAQAETNYDHIAFTFIGTGAIPASVQIYPSFPQTGDNFSRIGAPAGASVSADIAAAKVDTAAIKAKTDFLPSVTAGGTGGVFIAGTNAATSITTALTANITGNLSGSVGSVTGNVGGNVVGTVASVTGAVGSVTGNLGGNVTGSVGSVTGSVGSVTGAVGSVTGSVGSVTGAVGSVTGLTVSNLDATISSRMATYTQPTGFLAATFPTTVASTTNITSAAGITVSAIGANVITASSLAADASAEIADQVWDEVLSGHLTAGTTGNALNAAGAAGDPWTTALPGAYGAGTAGSLIGNNVNATISSRLASAGYTAPLDAGATATAVWNAATATYGSAGSYGLLFETNLDAAITTRQATIDATERNAIADALLKRDMSSVTGEASRSPLNALRFLRNKWSLSGTSLTVTKEDDATSAWTAVVTATAGANPITAVDPT